MTWHGRRQVEDINGLQNTVSHRHAAHQGNTKSLGFHLPPFRVGGLLGFVGTGFKAEPSASLSRGFHFTKSGSGQ